MSYDVNELSHDLRLLEAFLFAATEPQSEAELAERLPEGCDIPALLAELAERYGGHGIALKRVAGKWAFRTAEDLAPHLRIEKKVPRKPSRAAVETLSILAYHQPVTRAEVEEIRGVAVSKGSFDVLLEAGWIKPVGRRRTPGRPVTWGTTDLFMEHFGLASLADLPGIDELKAAGLLDTRPASVISGNISSNGDDLPEPIGEDDEMPPPLEADDAPRDGLTVVETVAQPEEFDDSERAIETGDDPADEEADQEDMAASEQSGSLEAHVDTQEDTGEDTQDETGDDAWEDLEARAPEGDSGDAAERNGQHHDKGYDEDREDAGTVEPSSNGDGEPTLGSAAAGVEPAPEPTMADTAPAFATESVSSMERE